MNHLSYLAAAYASIWVVLAIYIFVLIKRNGALISQIEVLEKRVADLEEQTDTDT